MTSSTDKCSTIFKDKRRFYNNVRMIVDGLAFYQTLSQHNEEAVSNLSRHMLPTKVSALQRLEPQLVANEVFNTDTSTDRQYRAIAWLIENNKNYLQRLILLEQAIVKEVKLASVEIDALIIRADLSDISIAFDVALNYLQQTANTQPDIIQYQQYY